MNGFQCMIWLGLLLFVCAAAGSGYVFFFASPDRRTRILGVLSGTVPTSALRPASDEPASAPAYADIKPSATGEDLLFELKAGQSITLVGVGERLVKAVAQLAERTQRSSGAAWSDKGGHSFAVFLNDRTVLLKIPRSEGGSSIWLKLKPLGGTALRSFYKGTDTRPGPARKFKLGGQTTPVAYELPNDLTPGVTWKVVDIGAFKASSSGQIEAIHNSDGFFYVLSRTNSSTQWLWNLDPDDSGSTQGRGGLFIGEEFDPAVEIGGTL